jgi:tetratricopeptide (TPR) repeat protein
MGIGALTASAQSKPAPTASPSASSFPQTSAKTPADYSKEPLVYEYLHTAMRYENDGTGTRETHGRVRVQASAGLTEAGQLIFAYNAENEAAEIRSVRVIEPNGELVTAGPDAVQDLSAPVAREAPMYTDARQKHVTVPGVSVGDIVEYDVVISSKPLLAGQFWQSYQFERHAICLDEQLDVDVPRDRPLKIKGSEGLQPAIHEEGDRRFYHWAASTLETPEPVKLFKNFQFDVTTMLEGVRQRPQRHVMFSTFQAWSDVGDWYAQLERDRRVAGPEIRAKADEIVRGQTTNLGKAQALYAWVSQNIRYVSLSFGVGRVQPHSAVEVLTNRYGDCKDKATLLEALLDAEGLHAQPVLISSRVEFDPDVPTPLQFDHAFTFLRVEGQEIWLDPTIGVGPFGYLLPQLRGKSALVVFTDTQPTLRETPKTLPFSAINNLEIQGSVAQDAQFDGTVRLETRGDLEVLILLLYTHLSQAQFSSFVAEELAKENKSLYGDVHYTDISVDNAPDTSKPVHAEFHVTGKLLYVNPKTANADQIARALTSIPLAQWHLLSLVPGANSGRDSSGKIQQMPVELKGPKEYSLRMDFTFAAINGINPVARKEFHSAKDLAEYESSSAWEGNRFQAAWRLSLRVAEVPLSDVKEYAAFVETVSESFAGSTTKREVTRAPVSDNSNPTSAPSGTTGSGASNSSKSAAASASADSIEEISPSAHMPVPRAEAAYREGQDQAKHKNWANAAAAFESATQTDPDFPDAWRELGRACMYERKYSDAEADFRKYLALAPHDRLAYLNLAWVLYDEKKFDEDVHMLEEHILHAPEDGDALARLGAAYLALHEPDRAVPALERATTILPKYEFAAYTLGRAYLETHQDEKAALAFQRAVTLNDSESVLNNVAYQLALHKSSLDAADNYARVAIQTVELELNQLDPNTAPARASILISKAAMYWDTMGWVKFQMNDFAKAEKYILAAWQIADDSTIGYHMGRVYEAQDRKKEAMEAYCHALALIPSDRKPDEDEVDARKRLASLLGGDSLVNDPVKAARATIQMRHAVSVANPDHLQGISEYSLLIGPNSKIMNIEAVISDNQLASLTDAIQSTAMPQVLPDTTISRLWRVGTLACANADQPCNFTLMPVSAAARLLVAPADTSQ